MRYSPSISHTEPDIFFICEIAFADRRGKLYKTRLLSNINTVSCVMYVYFKDNNSQDIKDRQTSKAHKHTVYCLYFESFF